MKKILLSLAVLAFSCVSAFADEVTMKYSGTTTANMIGDGSNEASSLGLDNAQWSVVANKGGNTNAPGLNKAGDFRLYWHTNGSNTITVESLTKATISQIAITFTGDDYSNVSITVGGEEVTGENGVFKINSTSFVIGNANTTNVQVRIKQIVITYTGGTPITVQPPKFSVEGGLFFEPQTVALTCETEGAKILYTIPAGQDPEYTDDDNYSGIFYDGTPLTITKTTTIKAMAVKDGKTSSIVTATYSIANVANAGTEENPFTVADAISVVNALADGATTPNTYFVKGIVIGNPDFQRNASEQLYGNVNFVMADSQDGDLLTIYRAKDYNNAVSLTKSLIQSLSNDSENLYTANYILGKSLSALNQSDKAIEAYEAARQQKETALILRTIGSEQLKTAEQADYSQEYKNAYNTFKLLDEKYCALTDDIINLAQSAMLAGDNSQYDFCKNKLLDETAKNEDCRVYIMLCMMSDATSDNQTEGYLKKTRELYNSL